MTLWGKNIVLIDFDDTMMTETIDEDKLDYEDGKKNPYIKKPDKLYHSKWVVINKRWCYN